MRLVFAYQHRFQHSSLGPWRGIVIYQTLLSLSRIRLRVRVYFVKGLGTRLVQGMMYHTFQVLHTCNTSRSLPCRLLSLLFVPQKTFCVCITLFLLLFFARSPRLNSPVADPSVQDIRKQTSKCRRSFFPITLTPGNRKRRTIRAYMKLSRKFGATLERRLAIRTSMGILSFQLV